jgi:hypothetical protein
MRHVTLRAKTLFPIKVKLALYETVATFSDCISVFSNHCLFFDATPYRHNLTASAPQYHSDPAGIGDMTPTPARPK